MLVLTEIEAKIVCPCGHTFDDDDATDFISWWGETTQADCPACGAQLLIEEHVTRTWSVRVRDSV